ncbi:MAG: cytochrome b [Bacteroidia bacterium]|nr:MAG: cytochrome b [Bacteroidia bacterium]
MKHANLPAIFDNNNYGKIACLLHWSIAILIIVNFIIALTFHQFQLYAIHIQIGLLVLLLVIIRIIWRSSTQYPIMVQQLSLIEKKGVQIAHLLLYTLMLLIPISGIFLVEAKGYPIRFFGLLDIPRLISIEPHTIAHQIKEIHQWLAYIIIFIAVIHALGALKHHFVDKDNVLLRMLPNHCKKIKNNGKK